MEAIAVKASFDTLRMLYPILADEVFLLRNLLDQVHETQLEFVIMTSFLRDSDKDEKRSSLVKAWVEQVRDATYDVEDIIDKFIYQFHERKRGGFIGHLRSIIFFPKDIIIKHRTVTQMQRSKRRVESILESKNRYLIDQIPKGINSSDAPEIDRQAEYPLLVEDEEIVGMKEKVDSLVSLLVGGDVGRMVISVTGMGGLGKTTLVVKAYQNQVVQKTFDCHACLSISQSFDIEELLRRLVKEFEIVVEDIKSMSEAALLHRVNTYLRSKSYVVVLDDVWNIQVWDELQRAFPSCQHRSRIMLTTRNEQVALSLGGGSHNFPLELLGQKDAWDLFYKHAFCQKPYTEELGRWALKFVERCEGLPLAIFSIGRLLASTPDDVWEKVYNSLNWELTNSDKLKRLHSIILLSFYDLPYYLRNCFLYFAMFPEDEIFHRKRLIRLWIAEGFVEPRVGLTLEQVAEDYLVELINRSMIQLVDTNEFGRVKTCRIHDVKREIALAKSKEMRFNMVYCGEQEASFDAKIRRLSICRGGESFQSNKGMKILRSFHVFDEKMASSSLHAVFAKFKWLRVLDLQDVAIESVPDELTDLFLLRYLNLRGTNVKKLPKSLDKLIYLQTLDLKDTQIDKLPNGIEKLRNLRHLYFHCKDDAYYSGFLPIRVPKEICDLEGLHSLSMVEANKKIIRKLGNLSKLRRFGVYNLRAVDGEELCKCLEKMEHLQNLSICSTGENESIKLDSLSSPPSPLRKLSLKGRLENVPHWLTSVSLTKLTDLRLHDSQLEENQLSLLQQLDQVVELVLVKAYNGNQLSFPDGSFPELRKLYFHTLPQLSHVHIAPGAMKSIREMNLLYCSKLKTVPEGIENVNLQKLYLVNMPEELIRRMRKDGQDRGRIQHIPYVKHADGRGGFEKLVD